MSGKLKIRCSASIYDVYWQSTEVSAEEDRPRVIHYEPAATIVGINYLQPPPNFQTGQKKPDGQVGVKGNASIPYVVSILYFISFPLRWGVRKRLGAFYSRNLGKITQGQRKKTRIGSDLLTDRFRFHSSSRDQSRDGFICVE